jgi:hypothetical protein
MRLPAATYFTRQFFFFTLHQQQNRQHHVKIWKLSKLQLSLLHMRCSIITETATYGKEYDRKKSLNQYSN